MTKLQKEFENTGYTSWINSDIYPDGKIYTQEYTRWLEKELIASRESKSAVPKELVELKQNEYRCKMCLNIYEKEWSDEEALNESKEIFGGEPTVENSDVVCDDCWKKLGFD